MSARFGDALAFYIRNFDEVEALRELIDPPDGISAADWRLVRMVVKHKADSDAATLLHGLMKGGVARAIEEARRVAFGLMGNARENWALAMSIGSDEEGPERLQLGIAIDSDPEFGPWLGVYLDFSRKRATCLRRARDVLGERKLDSYELNNPDRGWTGQLMVMRRGLQPDSRVDECDAWLHETSSLVLRDLFDHIAVPTK